MCNRLLEAMKVKYVITNFKKTLLYSILTLTLAGLCIKSDSDNIEHMLAKRKLEFQKSDSVNIVRKFGTDFQFKTSLRHARLMNGGDWTVFFIYLKYVKLGIDFKLVSSNLDKYHTLISIRLYPPYKHKILKHIKIGKTSFKELRSKFDVDTITFTQTRYKSIVLSSRTTKITRFTKHLTYVWTKALIKQVRQGIWIV